MKYGIICALNEEIDYIRRDIEIGNATRIARNEYYEGVLYGKNVVLVMSGIGKVAAAVTASILIDRFNVDNVIFCGTAGGIDKDLNTGDVVVADCLVQHDFFDGVNFFRIPRIGVSEFIPDETLSDNMLAGVSQYLSESIKNDIPQKYLDQFKITNPKVVKGTIASGDQFINDKSKNQWLSDNINNLKCVEMEGAAVAQVCYLYNKPFAVLRVISDSANEESGIAFDTFAAEAMPHFTRGNLKAFFSTI